MSGIARLVRRSMVPALLFVTAFATPLTAATTFVYDTFTEPGTKNSDLAAHSPDIGNPNSWVFLGGSGFPPMHLDPNIDKIYPQAASETSFYVNTTPPPSANYVVSLDVTVNAAGTFPAGNVLGRFSSTEKSGYAARIDGSGNLYLISYTNGLPTVLATTTLSGFTNGTTYRLSLVMFGTRLELAINGVVLLTAFDSTYTAAGFSGLALRSGTGGGNTQTVADNFGSGSLTPTAVSLTDEKAVRDGDQITIEWRTRFEIDNLGFNVVRDDAGRMTKINPGLISGSALFAGQGIPLPMGSSYTWHDARGFAGRYWIEEVRLDGTSSLHGPIEVDGETVAPARMRPARSPLLTELAPQSRESRVGSPQRELGGDLELSVAAGDGFVYETVSAHASSPCKTSQFQLAASDAAKLLVKRDGVFRVTRDELLAAGFDVSRDPKRLQLYVDACEIPISVSGESDGSFDSGDAIVFHGTGLDIPATDTRVYWLINGSGSGLRAKIAGLPRAPASTSPSFVSTVERKDRVVFFAALNNGDEDSFFGPVVSSFGTTQTLQLVHLDPAAPGSAFVEVSLQGVTILAGSPDHRVRIEVNGNLAGELEFDDRQKGSIRLPIPQSFLQEGANQVRLTAIGGPFDVSVIDFVRLSYWRLYLAQDNRLDCIVQGQQKTTLGNFTSGDVRVFDVTTPGIIEEVLASSSSSGGSWSVEVSPVKPGLRRLIAVESSAWLSPFGIRLNQPSALNGSSNASDLLILGRPELLATAEPLVTLRENQGLAVMTIELEDIYDEFSGGSSGPSGIRDFLAHTRKWSSPPRFVLLLGDASFDPRNYLGFGDRDLVPTKLLVTEFSKTASDDWLADFNGDHIPDVALGRLPAASVAEASLMIGKVVAYDEAAAGSWSSNVLFVSDNNDDNDFEAASAAVEALVPADYDVLRTYLGTLGTTAARADLLAKLNDGQLLVNYLGHGTVAAWAHETLLTTNHAKARTNGDRLPVVVALTCLTGYFHDTVTESLAEGFLRAPAGGAVAVWGSSALTFLKGQEPASRELFVQLFGGDVTLGEAVREAKRATPDGDVRRSWILFGDPSMRLKPLAP